MIREDIKNIILLYQMLTINIINNLVLLFKLPNNNAK